MAQNRLHLNFEISLRADRVAWLTQYINSIPFTPTAQELETMSDYILWGKQDPSMSDGPKRLRAEGINLDSTWSSTDEPDSLESLLESPTFNESNVSPITSTHYTSTPRKFSRSEARRLAPPYILSELESLWLQIDRTELILNFYEIARNKRTTPPRDTLLSKFSESDLDSMRAQADSFTQLDYSRSRKLLKELRTQQFAYIDSYKPSLLPLEQHFFSGETSPIPLQNYFGEDIYLYPLNPVFDPQLYARLLNPDHFPYPDEFTDEELNLIIHSIWTDVHPQNYIDFTNPDHVLAILESEQTLRDLDTYSNISCLWRALDTYRSLARLEPFLKDILELKLANQSNQFIADYIYDHYNHRYQPNYISTLFHKKCIGQICNAARLHYEAVINLVYPENFKKCKDCDKILLLNENNFMRRARSNDGYSPRCKCCEKIKRIGAKG